MVDLKLLSVFIKFFYEKSIVIFFSFFIISFFGYFYFTQIKNYSYTSIIQLHPINFDQSVDLKLLSSYDIYDISENTFLAIFQDIFEDRIITERVEVNSTTSMDETKIINYKILKEELTTSSEKAKKNIKKNLLVNNNEEYTNIEYEEKLRLLTQFESSNFLYLEPVLTKDKISLTGKKYNDIALIKYNSSIFNDPDIVKDILDEIISEITDQVRITVVSKVLQYIKFLEVKKNEKLLDLDIEKQNIIDDFIIGEKQKLVFLYENLEIALATGRIGTQGVATEFNATNASTSLNIYENNSMPYYFFGATAIKKEIDVVEKRLANIKEIDIEKLNATNSAIRQVEQDMSQKRFEKALEVSPLQLNVNEFKIFNYTIEKTEIRLNNSINKFVGIFLVSLFGILFGIAIVLILYLKGILTNIENTK